MSIFFTLNFIWTHTLNRKRKLRAVISFLRYQLALRIFPARYLVKWVDEVSFLVTRGETGLTGNLYCGFTEYQDMSFLAHFLRAGDHFIDIGANVGAYSLLASGVKAAHSTAFEPVPTTYARLQDQIRINALDHLVTPLNVGVGSEEGVLNFTNNQNCTNKVNTDPLNKAVSTTKVVTLDSVVDMKSVTAVKIDVEGFEMFVLQGGAKTFAHTNLSVLIIELNGSGIDYGFSDNELHAKICSFGFSPVSYQPEKRSITRCEEPGYNGNAIYVKDYQFAESRVTQSESVTLHTVGGMMF